MKKESFTFSFLICLLLIICLALLHWLQLTNTMLSKSNEQLCSIRGGKALRFSLLSVI